MGIFEDADRYDRELKEAGDRFMGKVKVEEPVMNEPVMNEPEYDEDDEDDDDDEIED